MKLLFLKYFLLLIPFYSLVDTTNWKVQSSSINFKIKNAGITIDGGFSGLESEIKFNPLKLDESSITASVDSKTIYTANDMRDGHLKKEEYFDVLKYPKISLKSTKIEKTGPITFNGTFKLTLKNVTKEIVIPFTFMKIPEKTEFKGSFTINRRDYGVGSNSMTLADNVTITIVLNVKE